MRWNLDFVSFRGQRSHLDFGCATTGHRPGRSNRTQASRLPVTSSRAAGSTVGERARCRGTRFVQKLGVWPIGGRFLHVMTLFNKFWRRSRARDGPMKRIAGQDGNHQSDLTASTL